MTFRALPPTQSCEGRPYNPAGPTVRQDNAPSAPVTRGGTMRGPERIDPILTKAGSDLGREPGPATDPVPCRVGAYRRDDACLLLHRGRRHRGCHRCCSGGRSRWIVSVEGQQADRGYHLRKAAICGLEWLTGRQSHLRRAPDHTDLDEFQGVGGGWLLLIRFFSCGA